MQKTTTFGGRHITIGVRNPCNYDCYYCIGRGCRQELVLFDFARIRKFYDNLSDFIMTTLECGTGEPTLHPQIKELIELCLHYGPLFLPTNNSLHPKFWLPSQHIDRIEVMAALHPENEAQISRFIEHLLYLKDHGAGVRVSYVCHPRRFFKKELYADFFKRYDIPVSLVPYSGAYGSSQYPNAYSQQEWDELNKKSPRGWAAELEREATWRNFRGIPCIAGYVDLFLSPDGQATRCLYDQQPLNTPYRTAKPCRVSYCGCGFLLADLNNRGPGYWNPFREKAGLKVLPETRQEPKTELSRKRAQYRRLREKYEGRNEEFVLHARHDWNPFNHLKGIDECLEKLFSREQVVDFVGIGTLFNLLVNSRSFKKELVGNLFDSSRKKQGQKVLGKIINPIEGFPRDEFSENILLSVQWPGELKIIIGKAVDKETNVFLLEIAEKKKLILNKCSVELKN